MKKKNTKKPADKSTKKPTEIPVSKTVARPLVPAVHLPPPPDDIEPGSPEEAFHYAITGAFARASLHRRNADRIRLESGVPYKGKDARLVGSVFHDRDALIKASERAEAEEREAEKRLADGERAKQELQRHLDRKANLKLADALLKHTAALANATAPTTATDQPPAPTKPHAKPAKCLTPAHREMIRAWLRDCGREFSSYATTHKLNAKTDGGWLGIYGGCIRARDGMLMDDPKKKPRSFRAWVFRHREKYGALASDIANLLDFEKLVDSVDRQDHPKKRR